MQKPNYGSDLLNLVVARGYLSKLISTPTVKDYLTQNHPDILDTFELVVNTVSMDEAVSSRRTRSKHGLRRCRC
jgi:hypothetical protein